MNLLSILGKVGGSILADVLPGANTILKVVNGFLSDEDKLSDKATGTDIKAAISSMPANVQLDILKKEFDVEIVNIKEHTKVVAALCEVDKAGNSTRPAVAIMMARVVAFSVVVLISMLVIAIGNNWPLVLAMLGTPTALLRAYFGMRTKEKQHKYLAATGAAPTSNMVECNSYRVGAYCTGLGIWSPVKLLAKRRS